MVTITVFQAIYILIAFVLLLIGGGIQIWWIKKKHEETILLNDAETAIQVNEAYHFGYSDGYEDGRKSIVNDFNNMDKVKATVDDEDCD